MGWHWGILASSGGAAGAFDLITTTVLGSSGTISFTGLDTGAAGYKHLQIRATLQTDVNNNLNVNPSFRFNSDTSASYKSHHLNGSGSSVTSSEAGPGSTFDLIDASPGYAGSASIFSGVIIDILDFSNTSKNTTIKALTGSVNTGETDVTLQSGVYLKTDAVTSIQFTSTFRAGTRISIYGVK